MATDDSVVNNPDQPEYPQVRDALHSFGQALDAEPITPMPDDVWEQIQTALALEASSSVVDLSTMRSSTATQSHSQREHQRQFQRPSLGTKWIGGLVAASVSLLAVGIAVNVLSPDESGQIEFRWMTRRMNSQTDESRRIKPDEVRRMKPVRMNSGG